MIFACTILFTACGISSDKITSTALVEIAQTQTATPTTTPTITPTPTFTETPTITFTPTLMGGGQGKLIFYYRKTFGYEKEFPQLQGEGNIIHRWTS
jgi:hypothetical protein